MELQLIYIYIHNFKGVKNQGFNLHSGYSVNFRQTGSSDVFSPPNFSIEVISSKLPHLFHPDIKDIRGIIGENGAGKSTLIDYLTFAGHDQSYAQKPEGNTRDILVYSIKENGEVRLKVAIGSSWGYEDVQHQANVPAGTRFLRIDEFLYEELEDFRTTSFIYYSNVFDNKIQWPNGGLNSISTNFFLRNDQERLTNTKVSVDVLEAHRTMESKRQIEFVLQFRNVVNLPLEIPKEIYVRYNGFSRNSLEVKEMDSNVTNTGEEFRKPLKLWLEFTNEKVIDLDLPQKTRLKREYFHYMIDNMIVNDNDIMYSSFPSFKDYKLRFLEYLTGIYKEQNGDVDLDDLIRFATGEEIHVEQNAKVPIGKNLFQYTLGTSSLKSCLQSFKNFYDYLFGPQFTFLTSGPGGFVIPLNDASHELYSRYYNSLYITTYLDFSFPELSTGELGFLTLFSRFYSLVSGTNPYFAENHQKNLIIFIDEGDLYFHPIWQSKFIDYINEMLPKIFPGFSLQLFISSHSPFIASDLTTHHLLFMKRANNLNKHRDIRGSAGEVVDVPDKTFAANIHELLSHSFFLKGAHIGELAKKVLYKMLDQMDGKFTGKQRFSNEELRALIEEVGEPWMRSRLNEKFNTYRSQQQL